VLDDLDAHRRLEPMQSDVDRGHHRFLIDRLDARIQPQAEDENGEEDQGETEDSPHPG